MSPHYPFYGRYNSMMFCGPSRFLWFSFGSLATFAWMHYHRDHCRSKAQIGYDHGHGRWSHHGRSTRFDDEPQQQQQWGTRRDVGAPDDVSRFDANGGRREPVVAEASGRYSADREFDRLREMSRNAEETVSFVFKSRMSRWC